MIKGFSSKLLHGLVRTKCKEKLKADGSGERVVFITVEIFFYSPAKFTSKGGYVVTVFVDSIIITITEITIFRIKGFA